jgi:hypothetical protein
MIGTQIEVANRAHSYAIAPSAWPHEFVAHAPLDLCDHPARVSVHWHRACHKEDLPGNSCTLPLIG